ncbi:hypothetical protein Tco_1200334 [Tanacetum coccineum]
MNKLNALKTTTQRLERQTFTHSLLFERAFSRLFSNDVRTFKYELSQNMNNLEKQLNNEILHEKDSKSALSKTSKTTLKWKLRTLMQHMESVKKSIDERALHKREYDTRVNERQMQTTEGKVDTCKALDASLVDIESSRTESKEQDTSSRLGNDAHADDADIRPIYDEEPMVEVQMTAEINVFVTRQ